MQLLNSKIYTGHTTHTRYTPVKRFFKYHLNYLFIDLNEASALNQLPLFKWNSRFFFSLHDHNYLVPGKAPIQTKLTHFMKKNAPSIKYKTAYLLTSPTFFGINFNPVSFFYLLNDSDVIVAIIAEVHNTFKEKHLYLLTDPVAKQNHLSFERIKKFHVSPFFKIEGKYCFLFSKKTAMIDISINYFKGKEHMFNANLKLKNQDLSPHAFFKMTFNFISTAMSTFPKIVLQAAKIKFLNGLTHFKNNGLNSKNSYSRRSPSLFSKLAIKLAHGYFQKLQVGSLLIHCPDGTDLTYGTPNSGPSASITVDDYRFFNQLILNSDIGFAESYIRQYWRTDSLESIFDVFIANKAILEITNPLIKVRRMIHFVQHRLRKNSISKSKQNIYEHYDLGNDFFKLFLDENRVYSSAIFNSNASSLEDAQIDKLNKALQMADVQPHHRILEIGSGWGALAIHAVKTIGCHVTTVTISEKQYNHVKQLINQHHLDAKIEVKLMDYRLLTGKYDRIISIEMLESVGHEYLPVYFKKCHDLLHRNGKAMFQCIMIPDERYAAYKKSPDFIQKYIFPGGHLPSISSIKSAISSANLHWKHSSEITQHYVDTLRIWEQQFMSNKTNILSMGFDHSFINTWQYYFNYCSSAFKSNFIHNYQFTINK